MNRCDGTTFSLQKCWHTYLVSRWDLSIGWTWGIACITNTLWVDSPDIFKRHVHLGCTNTLSVKVRSLHHWESFVFNWFVDVLLGFTIITRVNCIGAITLFECWSNTLEVESKKRCAIFIGTWARLISIDHKNIFDEFSVIPLIVYLKFSNLKVDHYIILNYPNRAKIN
jgi:hypothetical protein